MLLCLAIKVSEEKNMFLERMFSCEAVGQTGLRIVYKTISALDFSKKGHFVVSFTLIL